MCTAAEGWRRCREGARGVSRVGAEKGNGKAMHRAERCSCSGRPLPVVANQSKVELQIGLAAEGV